MPIQRLEDSGWIEGHASLALPTSCDANAHSAKACSIRSPASFAN
jgi:hypothetical protein